MREDLTFRSHRIIADDRSGKALAQIYIGDRQVGDRLEAETLPQVLSKAKEWVVARLDQVRQEQTAPNIATKARYLDFLTTQKLYDYEQKILAEHAKQGVMTASQIARTAGWEDYGATNTHYGSLGRRIAEFLSLDPLKRNNGEEIWTTAIASDFGRGGEPDTKHFEWLMHSELAEAIHEAGLLSERPAWLDERIRLGEDSGAAPSGESFRIKLTSGNIRNGHIYLKDHLDHFPREAIGGSNRSRAAEDTLLLDFGHGETVETDIDGEDKKIFRDRGAVRRFMESVLARPGDEVQITNTAPSRYALRHVPQPEPEPINDQALRARLKSDQPRAWLTSFWGFTPENWGCVGFSKPGRLDTFLKECGPDPLMVIYGSHSPQTPVELRGKILGLYALADQTGDAEEFVDPTRLRTARSEAENPSAWAHSLRAVRAWSIPAELAPDVGDFAHETYSPEKGQAIGVHGQPLTPAETRKLLELPMEEREVYRGAPLDPQGLARLSDRLKPSPAGPLAQRGWSVEPPDGDKHLYILRLSGDPAAFLGEVLAVEAGQAIFKVGMSRHPTKRNADINRNYPQGAYLWEILHSTYREGFAPRDAREHTVKGEDRMKRFLAMTGQSLGGEFFLADEDLILRAWALGKREAGFGGEDE